MNAWNKLRSYFNKEADTEGLTSKQRAQISELESQIADLKSQIDNIKASTAENAEGEVEGEPENPNQEAPQETPEETGYQHPDWWKGNEDNNNAMYAMSNTGNTAAQLMYHPSQNKYTLSLTNGRQIDVNPGSEQGQKVLRHFAAHQNNLTNAGQYKAMQQQNAQNKTTPIQNVTPTQSKAYSNYFNPGQARTQYVQNQLSQGQNVNTRYGTIKPTGNTGRGYGTVNPQVREWYNTRAPDELYNNGVKFRKDNKGGYYKVDAPSDKVIGANEAWRINFQNIMNNNNNMRGSEWPDMRASEWSDMAVA